MPLMQIGYVNIDECDDDYVDVDLDLVVAIAVVDEFQIPALHLSATMDVQSKSHHKLIAARKRMRRSSPIEEDNIQKSMKVNDMGNCNGSWQMAISKC